MKNTYALVIGLLPLSAMAQECSVAIPADAVVITSPGVVAQQDTVIWVCSNLSGQFTGSNNLIIVEAGGLWNLVGSNNTVYLYSGVNLTLSGSGNTIYLTITSDTSPVGGATNTVVPCTTMAYDRTNAPAGGCSFASVEERQASAPIRISPVPAHDAIRVVLPPQEALRGLRLIDSGGREVLGAGVIGRDGQIDVSALPPGRYVLEAVLADRVVRTPWIKE